MGPERRDTDTRTVKLGDFINQLNALQASLGADATVKIVIGNTVTDIYEAHRYEGNVGVVGIADE